MKENGLNMVDLRDNRYNQIIHMVSAACGAEDFYTTEVKFFMNSFVILYSNFLNNSNRIIRVEQKMCLWLKV